MSNIYEIKCGDFSLKQTLLCGQYFRAEPLSEGQFSVTLWGHTAKLRQQGDILFIDTATDEGARVITEALAVNEDYSHIKAILSSDSLMREAMALSRGLRIMKQPLFETVISFIISQNNNIPRICGIISRLCSHFGQPIDGGFAFPTPKDLSGLCREKLAPLRCGFRDKYILDAARKFSDGEINEETVKTGPLELAQRELMKITGVGPKVADCALLFGAHRLDAFPVDVWIKRAMSHYYPNGLPKEFLPFAGIAQQYIFVYAREHLPQGS